MGTACNLTDINAGEHVNRACQTAEIPAEYRWPICGQAHSQERRRALYGFVVKTHGCTVGVTRVAWGRLCLLSCRITSAGTIAGGSESWQISKESQLLTILKRGGLCER